MRLGELISVLERKNPQGHVLFDFVYLVPEGIHSYRGDYSQLAIGYKNGGEVKIGDFLILLRDADSKTFTGYKGGEFTMNDRTLVWVANHNEAGRTAIIDVRDDGDDVRLVTRVLPF